MPTPEPHYSQEAEADALKCRIRQRLVELLAESNDNAIPYDDAGIALLADALREHLPAPPAPEVTATVTDDGLRVSFTVVPVGAIDADA